MICPPDLRWDPLLIASQISSTAVLHQLFPVLDLIRPATISGLLALVSASDRQAARRFNDVFGPTKYCRIPWWMTLSVPGASSSEQPRRGLRQFRRPLALRVVVGAVRGPRINRTSGDGVLFSATLYAVKFDFRFDLRSATRGVSVTMLRRE
jgi:hypothetical protein